MLNLKIIFNFLGFLLVLDGFFMVLGIPFSLYYGDNDVITLLMCGAGTSAAYYELWGSFYQLLFFLILFIGGCAGSTGGGIKIVRHLLLIKNSFSELRRLIHPRACYPG